MKPGVTSFKAYRIHGLDELPAAVAEYRDRYGCPPPSIVLRDVPEDLTEVEGIPVESDGIVPSGLAYLEALKVPM